MASEREAEDRLFLVDGSRSMAARLRSGQRKLDIVKGGLKQFCLERWPFSYYPWPLRIGIVAYRFLGTPGEARFEEVVPLYPEPLSLELYLLEGLSAKGGSPLDHALGYGLAVLGESLRGRRRLYIISDGGNDGEDPVPLARELGEQGIELTCVELANEPGALLQDLARAAGGCYRLARDEREFREAIW